LQGFAKENCRIQGEFLLFFAALGFFPPKLLRCKTCPLCGTCGVLPFGSIPLVALRTPAGTGFRPPLQHLPRLCLLTFFFCKAMHFMGFPKDFCAPMPTGSIKKHGRHWRGVRSTLQSNGAGKGPAEPRKRHIKSALGSGQNCGL